MNEKTISRRVYEAAFSRQDAPNLVRDYIDPILGALDELEARIQKLEPASLPTPPLPLPPPVAR